MRPRAAAWQTIRYLLGNNLPNNWSKIWRNAIFKFCMTTVIVLQSENKQTPPLVLVLADFIIRSLPPPPPPLLRNHVTLLLYQSSSGLSIRNPCCLPSDSRIELLFLCFTAQFSGSSPCLNCDNREVKQRASGSGLFLYTWAVILSKRLGKSSL